MLYLANTLDNAIEACCKIPSGHPRKISARARYTKEGYFSFEIINTKENEIRKKKGRFLTDKEDPRSHGLGIASVQEIIEKNGGTLDIFYTEKEFALRSLFHKGKMKRRLSLQSRNF